ncbi:Bacillopeptidase F [Geobacteraceae bacterium]|nr:Bacillopeptidase F [Geobacteraceae bacterium]
MVFRSPKWMVSVAFFLACLVISLAAVTFAAPVPTVQIQDSVSEGIRSPLRISGDSLGNAYVTDSLVRGVLKYDSFGHLAQVIKTAVTPQGVAVASDGTLLVGQGTFVAMINAAGEETGRLGAGTGQFKMANGITVDDDGSIYVVDSLDNSVQVFNAAGAFVRKFGSFGTTAGKFSTPSGIAFEKVAKQVAVVDTRTGRIQFFDKSGVYKRTIGGFGTNPLRFTAPQGVSFEYTNDPTPVLKRMYVVDTFQSTVQAIDPATPPVFLSYIGSYGSTSGKLMVPSDVHFDQSSGRLLVVNGFGNVTVYGIDGGGLAVDMIPPALSIAPIISPFTNPTLDISGTVEAGATLNVAASGSVTVGAITFPTPSTWQATLSGFAAGGSTITVTARDAAKNATTQSVTVSYLQAGPMLTLEPLPVFTADANHQLSGLVDPGSVVTVTNTTTGKSAKALVFGDTWSCRVPLVAGANAISVKAEKSLSAATTATATTTLDATPPSITVSTLADGSYTSEQVQNIQMVVTDANIDVVALNGQPIVPVNGSFSTAVTLNPGPNVIMVAAVDLAGNVATDIRTIIFDATRPEVTFTAPADGSYVTADHVTVSGTLDQTATISVGGMPARMDGTSWSADVTLSPGINTIEVVAVDLAGNVTSVKRTVTYDTGSPALVISSPSQDLVTNLKTIGFAGHVTDPSPVTLVADVDGTPVAVTVTDGSFTLAATFAGEGSHAITFAATDAAGNVSRVTRTVIYDGTPPALTLDAVNTPYPSTLSGTVEAGATVTVEDRNGSAGTVTRGAGTWSAILELGGYDADSLAVRAADAAGNSTVRSLVVNAPDGDVNGDGTVTIHDVLLALRIFTQQTAPTVSHLAHGDIGPLYQGKARPNGVIDLVDAILIMRKALGMPSW